MSKCVESLEFIVRFLEYEVPSIILESAGWGKAGSDAEWRLY